MNENPPTPETPEVAGVVTTTDPAEEQAVAGSNRQIKTIEDWMKAEENRPETEKERKKRERRERSIKVIGAVTDGLSALSNLFFTTQYAPNMYNHEKGSMVNASNERLERLKAEREKKRDEYLNFALKLGDVENERARTLRDLEAKQEARKLAREKAERDAELHKWQEALQPDKQREQKGKADKAEQDAIAAQYEAQFAPQLQEAKLDTERARAGAQRASAANSYASASAHNRSNPNEFSAWDEHGNEHKFKTEDAAIAYAKQHGTYQETEEEETSTTKGKSAGRATDTTTTKKKKTGHAARPQKKESPTAGGEAGKKSPTS